MDRKRFVRDFWNKILKPLLIISALGFVIRFFIKVLAEDSNERQFVNLMSFGIVIAGLIITAGFLLNFVFKLIKENTPISTQNYIARNSEKISVISNIIFALLFIFFTLRFIKKAEYANLIGFTLITLFAVFSKKIYKNN